jgi:hypothetical protein
MYSSDMGGDEGPENQEQGHDEKTPKEVRDGEVRENRVDKSAQRKESS